MAMAMAMAIILMVLAGCSVETTKSESHVEKQLAIANDEIRNLRSKLGKERALRAIDEINYRGKLAGDSERIASLLLNSEDFLDQNYGASVLSVAVQRNPRYLPVALNRVRKLGLKGNKSHWDQTEAWLKKKSLTDKKQ